MPTKNPHVNVVLGSSLYNDARVLAGRGMCYYRRRLDIYLKRHLKFKRISHFLKLLKKGNSHGVMLIG